VAVTRVIPKRKREAYAFSMPKLGATATKTVQLKFANLLDFRGFRRVLLVRVSPEIALISRGSSVFRCRHPRGRL
jgi:hypothetical protein